MDTSSKRNLQKQAVTDVLTWMEDTISSTEFTSLIEEQNHHWKKLFPAKVAFLPAAGINYHALTELIYDVIGKRLGEKTAFLNISHDGKRHIIDTVIPAFNVLNNTCSIIGSDFTSFLPNDAEELINEKLNAGKKSVTIVDEINDSYCIFNKSPLDYLNFIKLDLLFTAFHNLLEKFTTVPKIKKDFQEALYIDPVFLICELPNILPFYTYQESDLKSKLYSTKETTLTITPPEIIYNEFNKLDDSYPLICRNPVNDNYTLSKCLTDHLRRCATRNTPNKILKMCYPLYAFYANNILSANTLYESTVASRRIGCKLFNPKSPIVPIKDFLRLQIPSTPNRTRITEDKKLLIAAQLYTIRQFDNYMQSQQYLHFKCPYQYKIGNKRTPIKDTVHLSCDVLFTMWLFIRYSDMFHIALISQCEDMFDSKGQTEESGIIVPKHFFTAFNFNKNVFKFYPTLHKKYGQFIESKANELTNLLENHIKKDNENSVLKQWVDIVQQVEKIFVRYAYQDIEKAKNKQEEQEYQGKPLPWSKFIRLEVHEILSSLFTKLNWSNGVNPLNLSNETFNNISNYHRYLSWIDPSIK